MRHNQKDSGILEEIGNVFAVWFGSTVVMIMLAVLLVMLGRVFDMIPQENIVIGLWILGFGAVLSFAFKVRLGFDFLAKSVFLVVFAGIAYLLGTSILSLPGAKVFKQGPFYEAHQSLMQFIASAIEFSPIVISGFYVICILFLIIEKYIVTKQKKER
jgi:hypothetical protein